MDAWYAIQVKRHKESLAARWLARKSVPAFLPLIEVARPRGTGRTSRLEPLFPGYLFGRLNGDGAQWDAVRWTPGVVRVLGTGDTPGPVPGEVIATIHRRTTEFGFIRPEPHLASGARVRFCRGPFQGLEAVFEPLSRGQRVRVLLALVGHTRAVEIDAPDVEPV